MGPEEEIIFTDDLWPIRCQKVRYHQDARFVKRLMPPPNEVAPRRRGSTNKLLGTGTASGVVPNWDSDIVAAPREATLSDLEQIETLGVDDFAAPLDQMVIPAAKAGERLSPQVLNTSITQFMTTMARTQE